MQENKNTKFAKPHIRARNNCYFVTLAKNRLLMRCKVVTTQTLPCVTVVTF